MGLFNKLFAKSANMSNEVRSKKYTEWDTKHGEAYFAEILETQFSQYEIREDIPVSELGGTDGRDYDFGLYQNGRLVAVVILVEHNKDTNRLYRSSKDAANKAGIPFINFYLQMQNERDYVIDRIRRFINR